MTTTPQQAAQALLAWAEKNEVAHDQVSKNHYVVELPGTRKLKTAVSVKFSAAAMACQAFVIRHPDENREEFFRWLLLRNAKLHGAAFMIDPLDDVYLVGELPITAVDDATLDTLMGALLSASDDSFNDLLALGFITSMRKEWDWRVSRGESTRNLDAFRQLLE